MDIFFFQENYLVLLIWLAMLIWYIIGYLTICGLNAVIIAEDLYYDPSRNWRFYLLALGGPLLLMRLVAINEGRIFRHGLALPGRSSQKALCKSQALYAKFVEMVERNPELNKHPSGWKGWREVYAIESRKLQ